MESTNTHSNTLGKATPVGKLPGVTRAVLTRILVSQGTWEGCYVGLKSACNDQG